MGLQDKEIKFHTLKNENGRNYKELIQIKYLSSYSKIIYNLFTHLKKRTPNMKLA